MRVPTPWPIVLEIDSTPTAVRAALEHCDCVLVQVGLGDEARGLAQLVLAEALNNVVEHAYLEQPDGKIFLNISGEIDKLTCKMTDLGRPMPGLQLPQTDLPDSSGPLDSLPEGGFGWFLIHQLTHELAYVRSEDANILTFDLIFD